MYARLTGAAQRIRGTGRTGPTENPVAFPFAFPVGSFGSVVDRNVCLPLGVSDIDGIHHRVARAAAEAGHRLPGGCLR